MLIEYVSLLYMQFTAEEIQVVTEMELCDLKFKWEIASGLAKWRECMKNLTYLILRKKVLLFTSEWLVKYPFTN